MNVHAIVFKFVRDYAICINENYETLYIRRDYVSDGVREDDIININGLNIDKSIEVWK